jgi:hypothetical protein
VLALFWKKNGRTALRLALVIAAVAILGVVVLPLVLYRGPVARDTPLMREISSMHRICTKLRWYADQHQNFPLTSAATSNVDSLVAEGILTADDAAYIKQQHIEFEGFDPGRIGPDIEVMRATFANTRAPRRIFGYSDGHVAVCDLNKAR